MRAFRNAARRIIGPYNPAIDYRALRDSASQGTFTGSRSSEEDVELAQEKEIAQIEDKI